MYSSQTSSEVQWKIAGEGQVYSIKLSAYQNQDWMRSLRKWAETEKKGKTELFYNISISEVDRKDLKEGSVACTTKKGETVRKSEFLTTSYLAHTSNEDSKRILLLASLISSSTMATVNCVIETKFHFVIGSRRNKSRVFRENCGHKIIL
jgi:hypothetical protein